MSIQSFVTGFPRVGPKREYKWAVEKPNFIRQNGKPVIMHSDKEIFATQEEFCEAYNFKSDLVSDYIVAGKTPEEIRDYFWGKNN